MGDRELFEKAVREKFVTTENSLGRSSDGIYYNTVATNTFRGRRQSQYADVQMLWEIWRAAAEIGKATASAGEGGKA